MRRLAALFEEILSTRNLWHAWLTFRKGKRRRVTVQRFEATVTRALFALHRELEAGTWRPRPYRLRMIEEPKRRLIAAAAVRDRVVHHAIYRVLSPRLDSRLIDTTYACVEGRGSHRALIAFLGAARRHRYVLLLDIRHYFMSIHHETLLDVFARMLREPRLLKLLRTITASGEGLYAPDDVRAFLSLPEGFPPPGCGLPIGNLTSQWWGNHYLSGFDHFVKRTLRLPHYQRYMDDLSLFGDSRAQLEEARAAASEWLWRERRLRLKHPKAAVRETAAWHTYLGHRVSRAGIEPSRQMLRKMQQRVGAHVLTGDVAKVERSMASYLGILGLGGLSGR